jgi:hypothetical protein
MKRLSNVLVVSVVGLTWAVSCWNTASCHNAPEILRAPVAAVVLNAESAVDTSSFIFKYRQAVREVVNVQIGSWIRHAGLLHRDFIDHNDVQAQDDEQEELEDQQNNLPDHYSGMAPPIITPHQAPASPRVLELRAGLELLAARGLPEEANASSKQHAAPPLVWDNENDIPKYFDELIEACSETIGHWDQSLSHFHEACFGKLHSLIKEPRCTTTLDSRTECSQMNKEGSSSRTRAQLILGDPHFTKDTLNVIILGAGPVGLFLTSALMEMQQRVVADGAEALEIRVVVFENRVATPGRKSLYARDWMTDISRDYMEGTLPSKLLQLLDVLFNTEGEDANVSLPINALETLLLLSNRAAGVKFIYDDYRNYEEELNAIPNLVVFDASGHHIQKLELGKISDTSALWKTGKEDAAEEREQAVQRERLRDFQKEGVGLYVASHETEHSGTILYPTFGDAPSTPGGPYNIYFLKVKLVAPLVRISARSDVFDTRSGRRAPDICYHNDDDERNIDQESSEELPMHWCGPHFSYDMGNNYRSDIYEAMEENDYNPGFNFRLALLNLTPGQFAFVQEVMQQPACHGVGVAEGSGRKVPLSCLKTPYDAEGGAAKNVLHRNKVFKILNSFRHPPVSGSNELEAGPVWSTFVYRPYMYDNPVAPFGMNRYLFGAESAEDSVPVLRIGDSLFSGDPNASTGLNTSMRIIQNFQCFLWGSDDLECDLPPRRESDNTVVNNGDGAHVE